MRRPSLYHPDVATRQYAKAEPLYQRALRIWEKTLGPKHPHIAIALENYAKLLRELKRAKEAAPLEEWAKAIQATHKQ
jgi:hypothetical protein